MVLQYLHTIWRNDRLSNWRKKSIHLAEPSNGKVAPLFQPHHVITSILLIGRNQPLGRYELCDNLTIGEGSVRTLLKHLTTNGYIAPESRQGQKLTVKGQRFFDMVTKDIPLGLFLKLNHLVTHEYGYASLVKNRASMVVDGMRQRDEAMIHGGYGLAGTTTLVMKDGLILLPPNDFNPLDKYEQEILLILDSLRPEDNDVVVVGSADDRNIAREVSIAAAMTLFEVV